MIIADSGYWFAIMNPRDEYHQQALLAAGKYGKERMITTLPVLTEVCQLLLGRIGSKAQAAFIAGIADGGAVIHHLSDEDLGKAAELMTRYADLPMDFADASLVLLAEELGHGRILSTDERDFHTYRWKNREPFHNLLTSN